VLLWTLQRHGPVLASVAAGGVVGAEARYGIELLLPADGGIPWATFTVNAVGCLLIGALMVVVLELTAPHRLLRPFLGIGVLGGFTTFSGYAVGAQVLLVDGRPLLALAFLAAMPVVAIGFAWLGARGTRTITTRGYGGGHR
jgi:fluoride exporter